MIYFYFKEYQFLVRLTIGLSFLFISGCSAAGQQSRSPSSNAGPDARRNMESAKTYPVYLALGRKEAATAPRLLDSLLESSPFDSELIVQTQVKRQEKVFQIRIFTTTEFKTALGKKAEFQNSLKQEIDLEWIPPFYQLVLGMYSSDKMAQAKLKELNKREIQGWVIEKNSN